MVRRFCYINSWNNINQFELLGGLQFALDEASEKSKMLTLLVNSIPNCDQIIEKLFEASTCNKLKRGETISIDGVDLRLRSPASIKNHDDYGIIFTIHTSPQALSKIESNKHLDTVVLFSEVAKHLDVWKEQNDVIELTLDRNA